MPTIIKTGGLAGFKMREGDGPSSILEKDGNYQFEISGAESGESQSGNITLKLKLVVQDDDESSALLYSTIPVTGTVEGGRNAGEENIKRLGAVLISAGYTQEKVDAIASKGEFDLDILAEELIGRQCFGFVAQGYNQNGNLQSDIKWFIKKEKYEESRQSGVNFRRVPNPGRGGGGGGGGARQAGKPNGAIKRKTVDTSNLASGI